MKKHLFYVLTLILFCCLASTSLLHATQAPGADFAGIYADPNSQTATTTDNALIARPDFQIPAVSDIDITISTEIMPSNYLFPDTELFQADINTNYNGTSDFNSELFKIRIDNNNQAGYDITYHSYTAERSSGNALVLAMVIDSVNDGNMTFRDGSLMDGSLDPNGTHSMQYLLCTLETDVLPMHQPVLSSVVANAAASWDSETGAPNGSSLCIDYATPRGTTANDGTFDIVSVGFPDLATQSEVILIKVKILQEELGQAFNTNSSTEFYTDFVTFTLTEL